jgi:hypothetical protein
MWVEKLFGGVLRVLTPLGPRYIKPSLSQRIYLLWVFRHFQILPLLVLTSRQRRLIDALCQESGFISLPQANEWEAAILGDPGATSTRGSKWLAGAPLRCPSIGHSIVVCGGRVTRYATSRSRLPGLCYTFSAHAPDPPGSGWRGGFHHHAAANPAAPSEVVPASH